MTYKELRQEFTKQSFRNELTRKLGEVCCNCGTTENIEYHHIVPLAKGGTNKLSNIVPVCIECHCKAHGKTNSEGLKRARESGILGRKHKKSYEECIPILEKYFNLEIGKRQALEEMGYSPKTKSDTYFRRYKEENNIVNFYNNIDLRASQNKRLNTMKSNKLKNMQ